MARQRRRRRIVHRLIPAALFATLTATSSYAFTAANTVPESKAGAGSGAVTGYVISDATYTIDVLANPQQLLSSSLNLAGTTPATSQVRVRFYSTGSWYPCTLGAYSSATNKTAVSCSVTGASSTTATQLTVVAAQ